MCVKLHIDKKFFKVFKAMGKQQSKAKRNLIAKLANETHCEYSFLVNGLESSVWKRSMFLACLTDWDSLIESFNLKAPLVIGAGVFWKSNTN